jgi:hypothetical protein
MLWSIFGALMTFVLNFWWLFKCFWDSWHAYMLENVQPMFNKNHDMYLDWLAEKNHCQFLEPDFLWKCVHCEKMLHLCRDYSDSILDLSCMPKLQILVWNGFTPYMLTIPASLRMLLFSSEEFTKNPFMNPPPKDSMLIVFKLFWPFGTFLRLKVWVAIGLHCGCYDWCRVASINADIWDALVTLWFWVGCFSMLTIHMVATDNA